MKKLISYKTLLLVIIFYSASIDLYAKNNSFSVATYKDDTGTKSIHNIDPLDFKEINDNVLDFSLKTGVLWAKIELKNQNKTTSKYFLVANNPLIDTISFYYRKNNRWEVQHYGLMIATNQQPFKHHVPAIPILLNDTLPKTFYLKISSRMALDIPLAIIPESEFYQKTKNEYLFIGILAGIILVIILYSLYMYYETKHRNYLLYSISASMTLCIQSFILGYTPYYFFVENRSLAFYFFFVSLYLGVCSLTLFTKSFLSINEEDKSSLYLLNSIIALSVLLIPIAFFVSFPTLAILSILLSFYYSIGILYTGAISWIKKNKLAPFFTIAWIIYNVGLLSISLRVLDLIPTNWLSSNTGFACFFLEFTILFIALEYFRQLQKKEDQQTQLAHTKKLNQEVTIKTQELSTALAQQNDLLSEIHHRVKNNLQVIYSLFNLQERRVKNAETKHILGTGKNRIKSMALVHEHLYKNDSFNQINVQNYLSELISYLSNLYHRKVIIEQNIESISILNDLAIPVGLITTEVMSNSFKYAFPKDNNHNQITISFHQKNENYHLEIVDNGSGFNIDRYEEMNAKPLGIQLIKGLAKQLGGTVDIQTKQGSSFYFIFPINK